MTREIALAHCFGHIIFGQALNERNRGRIDFVCAEPLREVAEALVSQQPSFPHKVYPLAARELSRTTSTSPQIATAVDIRERR
jgi:hypothetical protein